MELVTLKPDHASPAVSVHNFRRAGQLGLSRVTDVCVRADLCAGAAPEMIRRGAQATEC